MSSWPVVVGTLGGAAIGAVAGLGGQWLNIRHQRRAQWEAVQRDRCSELLAVFQKLHPTRDVLTAFRLVEEAMNAYSALSIVAPSGLTKPALKCLDAADEYTTAVHDHSQALEDGTATPRTERAVEDAQGHLFDAEFEFVQAAYKYFKVPER